MYHWLADFAKEHIFINNTGMRIVVIMDYRKINVWEETSKISTVAAEKGHWSSIDLDLGTAKSIAFKETAVDAMFFSNQVLC